MMQTRSRSRSSLAKEDADKLAKKDSASSQSHYRSKAPVMEPNQLEIPDDLHLCIQEILKTEQKLKTCSSDEGLLKRLKYCKENIGGLIGFHKETGHLPSDWEYDHDLASSYVPKSFLFSAEKKPKKNIPWNPHICNDPLVGGEPKAARRNFKKIDEKFQADKLAKNHSASPQLEIPENLHFWIRKALEAERELQRCTSNEGLLRKLNHIEENIALATRFCKETGRLQSDWEYDPDIANSYFAKQKPKTNNPYLDIPKTVYYYVERANKAEQELKTRPSDEGLLQQLSFHTKQIGAAAEFFIAGGQLPSDWKYNPDNASSYVPIEVPPLPPAEKEIKMEIPRNPHIDSAPLKDKQAKTVWRNFKKLDKTFKTSTLLGLPLPTKESLFTRLDADDKFVTFICDFAVRVFNESCQMYRNNNSNSKHIIDPKVQECKYIKVRPCYLFYMTIEAREQGKLGAYEINLRCNLDDGAIVLDSFCIQGPEAWGTREGAFIILDAIYETVKDDSLDDPEVYYYKSGMVRRTGGYDFYNPSGWNRLWEWDDENDLDNVSDDEWIYQI